MSAEDTVEMIRRCALHSTPPALTNDLTWEQCREVISQITESLAGFNREGELAVAEPPRDGVIAIADSQPVEVP